MYIKAYVVSHPGNVREKNEDNFYFNGTVLETIGESVEYSLESVLNQPVMFGVYDGMGGISAGEKASRIATETAKRIFLQIDEYAGNYERVLLNVCREANDLICKEMKETIKQRMGSTAAMMLFYKNQFVLCNIGDSQIFILRNSRMVKISKDHTERENYEKIYGIAAENKKFKLTQHLGIFEEEMVIEPNIIPGQTKPNDRFLICSDGLTDMISTDEIETVLREGKPVGITTRKLRQMALRNGGKDNITIICIDLAV